MAAKTAAASSVRRATPDDAAAIARVHVESWQSSYRGILSNAFLETLSVAERTKHWRRNLTEPDRGIAGISSTGHPGHATFVGLAPDKGVIGFCSAGPNRGGAPIFAGEVYAIYLLDSAKRQGLGRALFLEAARWLASQQLEPLLVWVLADNQPAREFYRAIGGRELEPRLITIAATSYSEVAYGFFPSPVPAI
jgi:GNAT superfamily N-acetyltransferase